MNILLHKGKIFVLPFTAIFFMDTFPIFFCNKMDILQVGLLITPFVQNGTKCFISL